MFCFFFSFFQVAYKEEVIYGTSGYFSNPSNHTLFGVFDADWYSSGHNITTKSFDENLNLVYSNTREFYECEGFTQLKYAAFSFKYRSVDDSFVLIKCPDNTSYDAYCDNNVFLNIDRETGKCSNMSTPMEVNNLEGIAYLWDDSSNIYYIVSHDTIVGYKLSPGKEVKVVSNVTYDISGRDDDTEYYTSGYAVAAAFDLGM